MADIVTEQWIQIQRLEQALHITQWCNWLLLCLRQNQRPLVKVLRQTCCIYPAFFFVQNILDVLLKV
ncbi:unnamed protein product [Prunus brigantina]